MQRRRFLGVVGAGAGALAGCSQFDGPTGTSQSGPSTTESTASPAELEALPDGVYVQRYRETMSMQGTASAGPYEVALMYAAPHPFWNVNGTELSKMEPSGDIHGMAVVWDAETETVVPETGLWLKIERDDKLVSQEVIYPMLSQRMGYHYGANFRLNGDGEYTARVSVGAIPDAVELTGDYDGKFSEPVSAEIPFAFDEEQRSKVKVEEVDAYGEPGAVRPMQMEMVPQATAPKPGDLPGTLLGDPLLDDGRLVTTALDGDAAARFGASSYLTVSARSRYNGLVVPAMALFATVEREAETVFDGPLTRTFDSSLGYHYGAAVDELESGDEVTLAVDTPPQVARHEGYERAFLQMDDVMVTV